MKKRAVSRLAPVEWLSDGDGLGEVARPIRIESFGDSDFVGKALQQNGPENRRRKPRDLSGIFSR